MEKFSKYESYYVEEKLIKYYQYVLGIQFKVLDRLYMLINTNFNYQWRKCSKKT